MTPTFRQVANELHRGMPLYLYYIIQNLEANINISLGFK